MSRLLHAAAQQALEALAIADNIALVGAAYTPKSIDCGLRKIRESATALREALAQPEQPVQRKPLTHIQAKELVAKYGNDLLKLVFQTEAAHGIKE